MRGCSRTNGEDPVSVGGEDWFRERGLWAVGSDDTTIVCEPNHRVSAAVFLTEVLVHGT